MKHIRMQENAGNERRWESALAFLSLGILYAFLPASLILGPGWLLLLVEVILLAPLWVLWLTHHSFSYLIVRIINLSALISVALALAIGITLLFTQTVIIRSPTLAVASTLFHATIQLWLMNILVFSLWYWELDSGGPHVRHQSEYQAVDFLFPQLANQGHDHGRKWKPNFFDYVFVAFIAATAFSPADTLPLTQQAKLLMTGEIVLSLALILLVLGRVTNLL